jgi:inositol-phosphate transport system substrate-binding protein
LVIAGLIGMGGADLTAQDIRDVSISAWTVGPDDPSITRQLQLDIAANRLNAALEFSRVLGAGAADVLSAETAAVLQNVLNNVDGAPNINVAWSSEFNTDTWSSFKTRNLLAFQTRDSNQIADIIVTGHEMVGPHSAADPSFIQPLDDLVARYDATWGDFIQSTFEAAKGGDTLFAVPQDTEARVVWYRTDLLAEAGVSAAVINGLRADVESGAFTLEDLKDMGALLVSSGVVERGFAVSHRPTPGTDWYQLLFSFGGQIFDSAENKLVLDRGPALKALQYMDGMIKDGIIDPGIASAGWGGVWNQWYNNEVGIFLTGGTWHWAQFKNDTGAGTGFVDVEADVAVAEAWQFENLEFSLIPAGDGGNPNTASHPIVTMLSAVSSAENQ